MSFWAIGLETESGDWTVEGPWDFEESAHQEADNLGLRQYRVIEARSRDEAEAVLQRRRSRGQQPDLKTTDGPATPFNSGNFPQLRGLE